jgi:hypothetical protein
MDGFELIVHPRGFNENWDLGLVFSDVREELIEQLGGLIGWWRDVPRISGIVRASANVVLNRSDFSRRRTARGA